MLPLDRALSLSAALAWLEKRTADQTAATEAVLKINPLYGEVHRVIGGVSARAYRFDEAAEFARKATAVDRENYRAFADLGGHLMRTGDERAARRALETAFRADPRVQEAMAVAGVGELAAPTIAPGETLADVLADRAAFEDFDVDAAASRDYGFIQLHQLAVEHLLGAH